MKADKINKWHYDKQNLALKKVSLTLPHHTVNNVCLWWTETTRGRVGGIIVLLWSHEMHVWIETRARHFLNYIIQDCRIKQKNFESNFNSMWTEPKLIKEKDWLRCIFQETKRRSKQKQNSTKCRYMIISSISKNHTRKCCLRKLNGANLPSKIIYCVFHKINSQISKM